MQVSVDTKKEPTNLSLEEIEEKSKIYFNSKPGKMFDYHSAINAASKELCLTCPALLASRKELFDKACKMVLEKGYDYKKKKSRSSLYEQDDKTQEKKQHVSMEIRSKRIAELNEDIPELDVEMRLQMQQREKFKNINELTRAINCTEKLSELRGKKRKIQEELTTLQLKEAKVKKAKKYAENRKAFERKQSSSSSYSYTIDSFLKPVDSCPSFKQSKESEDNNKEDKEKGNTGMVEESLGDQLTTDSAEGTNDSETNSNFQ